jgi:hypothetical protein
VSFCVCVCACACLCKKQEAEQETAICVQPFSQVFLRASTAGVMTCQCRFQCVLLSTVESSRVTLRGGTALQTGRSWVRFPVRSLTVG